MSERGYDFFVSITYFTGNGSYQNFLFFATMLSSIILDINKKISNWIFTGISFEKIKSFDTNLEATKSYLAKGTQCLNSTTLFYSKTFFSII